MCDETIEESKRVKTQNFYILLAFNHYSVMDSCYYLLLSDKISSKTKAFITILIDVL